MSATTSNDSASFEVLRPVLGNRFVLTRSQLGVCACFAVFFMYLNYIPIFHSDIWCHVNYGNWMIEHGQPVQEDPFLPLAKGVRVVNNAWLSQLLFATAERWGGPQAMSNLFAVVVLAAFAVYTRVFYLLSGQKWLAMLGMGLLLATGWTRHAIIRPEIFGGLFLAILFWMLMRVEPWRSRTAVWKDSPASGFPKFFWFAIPILFTLWANMHGSFAIGLVVLGCHALGCILETLWRERSLKALPRSAEVRGWVWLTQLALAATLLNPYGLDLLIETARFGRNENLRDVLEWLPLRLIDFEGIQFLVATGITLVIVRFSQQRFRAAEVLLMGLLTLMMASTVRIIGWLAPIWTISMTPHLLDLWRQASPSVQRWWSNLRGDDTESESESTESGLFGWTPPPHTYTILCGLLIWCAFALSPISQPLLGDKPRDLGQVLSKGTPRGVTEFLRENPPKGMVWAPQWWGDWLAWDGPEQLQVFMTTTLHLAPHHVWRDYMRVAKADSGWERTLNRYAIKTVIMDKELQPVMHRAVRRSGKWRKIYEDDRGVVYEHTTLIRATAKEQSPQPRQESMQASSEGAQDTSAEETSGDADAVPVSTNDGGKEELQ